MMKLLLLLSFPFFVDNYIEIETSSPLPTFIHVGQQDP